MSFPALRSRVRPSALFAALATVITSAASNLTTTTADGNGEVASGGGGTITERGFVWSTSVNPTTADSKVTVAGSTGIYTGTMTGLSSSTFYHYRAYAINEAGTAYGADTTFTTSSGVASPRLLMMFGVGT